MNRKKKDKANRLFPPTLPASYLVISVVFAGNYQTYITMNEEIPAVTKHAKERKDVKSILFPIYPPTFHPHSFCGAGPEGNMTHPSPKTTTPAHTKYSERC
ncbi:hypothetical protein TNCV_836791 [Trichonephila clavipes]|nr:hypothetical protein TNCV_836791 [Trichonephila clavipes]